VTEASKARVLYVIVCGAGPAGDVGKLADLAHQREWDVQVISTPAARDFIDAPGLEAKTGRPIRSEYRKPGEPRSPKADAIIVAPATYNTINRWAAGISDTYALGLLAEAPGLGIPTVVLPFVNSALAGRQAFARSVDQLRNEGVRIILGPGEFEPHAPGTGSERVTTFPWLIALSEVERIYAQRKVSRPET
jgi:phosphopantothenoylcysteine synthetase/decarboxylase